MDQSNDFFEDVDGAVGGQGNDNFETSTPAGSDTAEQGDRFQFVNTRPRPRVPMPGTQQPKPAPSAENRGPAVDHSVADCASMLRFLDDRSTDSKGVGDTIRDQSVRLQNLVRFMLDHAGVRVFENENMLSMNYGNENDLLDRVTQIIQDTFPEGFTNFNEGTYLIFRDFIEKNLLIFGQHVKQLPRIIGPVIKFVVIAMTFGIDRAMYGIQYTDDIFMRFNWNDNDAYFRRLCSHQMKELNGCRNIYYNCFRVDGFDPRVAQDDLTISIDNQQNKPKEQQATNDPATVGQARPKTPERASSVQGHVSPGRPIIKTPTGDGGRKQEKRASFASRDEVKIISDTDTDLEFEDVNAQESRKKRINLPPTKPIHLQYGESGAETDDEAEKENIKPAKPLHIQRGETDAGLFDKPLAKVGKVYDLNKSYREVPPQSSGVLEETLKGLSSAGYNEEAIGNIVTTSAAIAQIASTIVSSTKKQDKKVYEEIPPPKLDIDLSVGSFDYDIEGRTIQQVLGKRFCSIQFVSDTVRKMVMRDILQTVASHPKSGLEARTIAVSQLGKEDPLKRGRAEIQALISDPYGHQDLEEMVPPPVLGKKDLTSEALKALQTRIGISSTDRFTIEDLSGIKLKNLLIGLRSVITSFGFRESEAYSLLLRVTSGLSHEAIWLAQHEHKIPFNDYWLSLQRTQKKVMSSREYEKKLHNLMQRDYVDNLEKTLNEILVYRQKISEAETDPNIRKLLCQRYTLRDFRTFVRRHYSSYASQINTCYADKLKLIAAQKDIPSFTNESTFHAQKCFLYMETIIEILAQAEPDSSIQREYREEKSHSRKPARIYTMAVSPVASIDQQASTEKTYRGPTPGPGRQGRQNQKENQSSRAQGKPPFRGQSNGRGSRMGRQINYRCHLCNKVGHSFKACRTYPNESYGNKECPVCQGHHTSLCKQEEMEVKRLSKSAYSLDRVAQVMELFNSQQQPQTSYGQQQGNYNQQQPGNYTNYNRYPTPGFNRNYKPRQFERGNDYQGRRSQYGNRDNNDRRAFTPGRSRYQNNYNNSNNYRPNRSNYNQGNRNGFQRPQGDGQFKYDQKHIQQLEEMIKSMKQQKFSGHVQNGQGNGLGNDGHQPLNSAVVLDPMSASFVPSQ